MTDSKSVSEILQEEQLTIREHMDPDKHWIGEALAVPTQTEIAATVGTTSSPGDSPFVARADHIHKLDKDIFPKTAIASPGATDDATTSSSFTTWLSTAAITIPTWASSAVLTVFISNVYAITAVPITYGLSATIGALAYESSDYGAITLTTINSRESVAYVLDVSGFSKGSQVINIGARRTSGTGQMRADTVSKITVMVQLRPA